jgi:hypothetical protein
MDSRFNSTRTTVALARDSMDSRYMYQFNWYLSADAMPVGQRPKSKRRNKKNETPGKTVKFSKMAHGNGNMPYAVAIPLMCRR